MNLYSTHADWWPLLSAPEEYEEDAEIYTALLKEACATPPVTLLELGSGGGNNAAFMKKDFRMTLTDIAPEMLRVSQKLNPECEHIQGDMRTIRLQREFDAVFIQDAIGYMTTHQDLSDAVATAYAHCRRGGAALFVPDYTKETFQASTYHGGHDGPERSMRYLQWDRDPDPEDSEYQIDFAYLFSTTDEPVHVAHETHRCGLFAIDTWMDLMREAGFEPDSVSVDTDELEPGYYRIFIGRKL